MTVLNANSAGQMQDLLLQLTVPDTNIVRQATNQLKKVLNKITSISALFSVLTTSADKNARQLAAVYLRKKIGSHWIKLTKQEKAQCQSILLESLIKEPERNIKNGIAGIITVVAKYSLPSGDWTALLSFLEALSKDQVPIHRELSLRIFRILLSNVEKSMRPHLSVLRHIFRGGLEDSDLGVKLDALKALSTMVQFLDDAESYAWFQSILPAMLAALAACVASGDDSSGAAILGLDVLEELCENPQDILQGQLPVMVQNVLQIASNPEVEMDIRERSAVLISSVVQHRSATLMQSPGLIELLIGSSVNILLESCRHAQELASEDDDDDEEDDHSSNCRGVAVQILDQVMLQMPCAAVYPLVMQMVTSLMNTEPASRRAAIFALMVSIEGAASLMRNDFESILNVVLQGLQDQDTGVREAACLAIGQLSDHMSDCMTLTHQRVIGAILTCLAQTNSPKHAKVNIKLCLAIEAICTEVDSGSCVEYLPVLMSSLFSLVQSQSTNIELVGSAINAIAAVAKNSATQFQPFFQQTITLLHSALQTVGEESAPLRAASLQCAGAVCLSSNEAGPVQALMELSLAAFNNEQDPIIREAAFHFWSQISQLLKVDFQPYMETVIKLTMEAIDSEEGMNIRSMKSDLNAEFGGNVADYEGDSDDEDESIDDDEAEDNDGEDSDEEGRYHCSILSGFLDEKVAAVDCLSSVAQHSGVIILPHLEHIIDVLEITAEYPHENVRLVVMKGFHDILIMARNLWAPTAANMVNSNVQVLVDRVLPIFFLLITDDECRDVVSSSLDALLSVFTSFKSEWRATFSEHQTDTVKCIISVLQEQTAAHKYQIADADKDTILDSVCDLIGGMGQALSDEPLFAGILREVMPALGARFAQQEPIVQSQIIGALGEVAEGQKAAMMPFIGEVLPIAMSSISSTNVRLRRNSAYCAGSIFLFAQLDANVANQYLQGLMQLTNQDMPGTDDASLAANDNVCSALCKLICGPSRAQLAIDYNACLQAIARHVPLSSDMDETLYVYPALLSVWARVSAPSKQSTLVPIIQSMCTILVDDQVDNSLKSSLAGQVKAMIQEMHGAVDLQAALTDDQKSVVQHIVSN